MAEVQKYEAGSAIKASPEKRFFISMLTRDVTVQQVVLDLIDNSVDGATKLKGRDEPLHGMRIAITCEPDRFEIADNCGGITPDIAANYAFRFGRPESKDSFPGEIGQFGVGMKRAIFKLGDYFRIESTSAGARFSVKQDVKEWEKATGDTWTFSFDDVVYKTSPENLTGTVIIVTKLKSSVSESFKLDTWLNRLCSEIESRFSYVIDLGMDIEVNGRKLLSKSIELLQSDDIKPGIDFFNYPEPNGSTRVRIYAGLGAKRDPKSLGWSIFCNGRQIVNSDTTKLTGWGLNGIPQYHREYDDFRGYVFFDGEDASKLPWNTTKDGVDRDSDIFIFTLLRMNRMARQVIDFLYQRKKENAALATISRGNTENTFESVASKIAQAIPIAISQLDGTPAQPFLGPKASVPDKLKTRTRVTYSVPTERFEKVKERLEVDTAAQVGLQTFDFYFKVEVDA